MGSRADATVAVDASSIPSDEDPGNLHLEDPITSYDHGIEALTNYHAWVLQAREFTTPKNERPLGGSFEPPPLTGASLISPTLSGRPRAQVSMLDDRCSPRSN